MLTSNKDYNPLIKELREALKLKDIDRMKEKALLAHALVHDKILTNYHIDTFQNQFLKNLDEESFRYKKSKNYDSIRTVAFFIFHITRIEDICANVIIGEKKQVIFENKWIEKLNIERVDTGNSMTLDEIDKLSMNINQKQLFSYRLEVGKRTIDIIQNLTKEDLKRKASKEQLESILETKSVLKDENSSWLIDFWGKKNIGELLLMPITRHQIVHLNDCNIIIKSKK